MKTLTLKKAYATATPRPWKAVHVPASQLQSNHFQVIGGSPHLPGLLQTVCNINGPHKHSNYEANAALMAHAVNALPDVVDALRMFMEQYDGSGDERRNRPEIIAARAALAKANKVEIPR